MMVQMGEEARFRLDVTFEGAPYDAGDIEQVQYLLFDGEGRLRHRGTASPGSDGRWDVDLSADEVAELGTGANSLEVAVTSSQVALPAFASHAFATVPPGTATLEDEL